MSPNNECLACSDTFWKQRSEAAYELATCSACARKTIVGRAKMISGLICFDCYTKETYAVCKECGFNTPGGQCTCKE